MRNVLNKADFIGRYQIQRVNNVLAEHGYPESKEDYVMNIMANAGGETDQQEVYEMISVALGYDLVDQEGKPYTPKWLS